MINRIKELVQQIPLGNKITVCYVLVLLALFLLLPVVQIKSLAGVDIMYYKLFTVSSSASLIFMVVLLVLLFGWNSTQSFRNTCYRLFGFQSPTAFISFLFLSFLLFALLMFGEGINVSREFISNNIRLSSGYLVLVMYLVMGMLWQLALTRLHRKQSANYIQSSTSKQTITEPKQFYQEKQQDDVLIKE